jgi:hypothetical protein
MIAPLPEQTIRRDFMKQASIVVLGLLFAFACKKSEQTTTTTQASTTTVSTSATATAPQPAPTTPVPATTSSAPASPAGAIASTDGEKPGTHIDITELKRTSGGTVNLKFTIANTSSEKLAMYSNLGDHMVSSDHYRGVSGIHLIDPVNKKKYFVVTDSEKNCVCSKDAPDIEPGGKLNLWAKFPAPPPEVTKVTIEIPHFAPIDDVPISQ